MVSHNNNLSDNSNVNKHLYKSGNVWYGKLHKGKPSGIGTYVFEKGIFKGEFDSYGMKNGKLDYKNDNVYEGEFHKNMKHGYGEMSYDNGRLVYKGDFYNDLYHGFGELVNKEGEILYKGQFKDGAVYFPDIKKKNEKILNIYSGESKILNSFNSLKERYEDVFLYDKTSTISEKQIGELISNSTKGNKNTKKLNIVINEHGTSSGQLKGNGFVTKSLKVINEQIVKLNCNKANEKSVDHIDITLNVCYGSKVLLKNKDLKNAIKSFLNSGLTVSVSTVDGQTLAISALVNDKNFMPLTKTKGDYLLNVYRFVKPGDLNNDKPYEERRYKTSSLFFKDKYKVEKSLISFLRRLNIGFKKPSKEEKNKKQQEILRKLNIEKRNKKSVAPTNMEKFLNAGNTGKISTQVNKPKPPKRIKTRTKNRPIFA